MDIIIHLVFGFIIFAFIIILTSYTLARFITKMPVDIESNNILILKHILLYFIIIFCEIIGFLTIVRGILS